MYLLNLYINIWIISVYSLSLLMWYIQYEFILNPYGVYYQTYWYIVHVKKVNNHLLLREYRWSVRAAITSILYITQGR